MDSELQLQLQLQQKEKKCVKNIPLIITSKKNRNNVHNIIIFFFLQCVHGKFFDRNLKKKEG